jgi:hypothetical protein
LLRAADQARKGKRFRPAVAAFHFDQERALWALHEELTTKTYRRCALPIFFPPVPSFFPADSCAQRTSRAYDS